LAEIENVQSVEAQLRAMESKKSRKGKHGSNDCAEGPKRGAGKFKKPKNWHNNNSNNNNHFGDDKKKFCLCHGFNSTHITDECKVLKAEAEKLKRQHDAGSKESRFKKKQEYKKKTEKDLNTFYEERFKELEGELEKQKKLSNYLQKKLKAAPKNNKKNLDSESTSSKE
jgi:hypothetical protein